MEKYINESGKECYRGVTEQTPFSADLFHEPSYQFESDKQLALFTNIGNLTVLDRMTGYGGRDTETAYREPGYGGRFWLASGSYNVITDSGAKTIGEAIEWVKKMSNTCVGI